MFYPKSPFFKFPEIESQIFNWNDQSDKTLEWVARAPKTTTYRINLLRTTTGDMKREILEKIWEKYRKTPKIFQVDNIPEILCIDPIETELIFHPPLKEVIVDGACASALLRGSHIYAPGVLAMNSGTQIDEHVNVFADLEGKCKKGTSIKYESDKKVYIGYGYAKMRRYQLYGENTKNKGIAIEMVSTISNVPSIGDLSSDKLLLQNFPSIVCSRVLCPQENDIILDMCSAPGNKTTHLAELICDNGIIIALDKTENKIELVRRKIDVYNLKSVKAFCFDSTKSLNPSLIGKNVLEGPPFSAESFDKILLDAPCSSLGNRPLLFVKNINTNMLKSYPKVQKNLFENAVGLLKPKGTLVYSTCTLTVAENEEIVKWAIKKFQNLILVEASPIFGGPGLSDYLDENANLVQRFGFNNLNNEVDSIGFFIAKFIKK